MKQTVKGFEVDDYGAPKEVIFYLKDNSWWFSPEPGAIFSTTALNQLNYISRDLNGWVEDDFCTKKELKEKIDKVFSNVVYKIANRLTKREEVHLPSLKLALLKELDLVEVGEK